MADAPSRFHALSIDQDREIDVVCVGAAIMDHLVKVEFDLFSTLGLVAGTMSLVDTGVVAGIREKTGHERSVSGGAEANTAVGVACLGLRSAFVGAVGTDEAGAHYARDLESAGVQAVLDYIPVMAGHTDDATGSSFVIVTPDGERTMLTALGVGPRLHHGHIDDELLSSAKIVYFSAYLLDYPGAGDLVSAIVNKARQHGTVLAFSLADPMCVERHHQTIEQLVESGIDLLFANESEATALSGMSGALESARDLIRGDGVVIVTRGANGAAIAQGAELFEVPARPIEEIVDATGAGDLFASGVLAGIAGGRDLKHSAALGALCAAEILDHLGARPNRDLADLARVADL